MIKPLITISVNNSLKDALDVMYNKNIKKLPVLDNNGKLVGIVSLTDIFRLIMQELNLLPSLLTDQLPVRDETFVSKVNELWLHDYLPF